MDEQELSEMDRIEWQIRNDFKPFYIAMCKEMLRHYPEKGESWKDEYYYIDTNTRYSSMPPIWVKKDMVKDSLIPTLEAIIKKWKKHKLESGEYLDMANMCAMIWLHIHDSLSEKVKKE